MWRPDESIRCFLLLFSTFYSQSLWLNLELEAQWVRALALNGHWSLIPGIHEVEGENQFLQFFPETLACVLWYAHVLVHVCAVVNQTRQKYLLPG